MATETSTDYYSSSQYSRTINYSYDGSGKLVTKEQYYGPSNETTYWNYTYDERGNKITEEFTRTGSSPWSTITTFTWNNIIGDASSSPESGSSEDDSTSSDFANNNPDFSDGILSCVRSKVDAVRTLTDIDTDKIIKEILEEE